MKDRNVHRFEVATADNVGANAQSVAVVLLEGAAIRADGGRPRAATENGHARRASGDNAWESLYAGKNLFVHRQSGIGPS